MARIYARVVDSRRKEVMGMAKDPVCGMEVDEKTAPGKSDYQGQTFYFCSIGCKKSFDKEPAKYSGQAHKHGTEHH
jgi:YHS domain-containing protein